MYIISVGRSFPEHYYDQETLIAAFKRHGAGRYYNLDRLECLHRNVRVDGRYLALPLNAYDELESFADANNAYIRIAVDLGERAINDALERAGLTPQEIDHLYFVSSTGIATPSIDALLVNRLSLRSDVKRSPLFGLGCVAGAAGVARATDYLLAFPDQVAVLLSVELCSLTLQKQDLSIPNIIAGGLFGDGAAAVALVGGNRKSKHRPVKVVASRSSFYRDTEHVMGWDVGRGGLRVVLSAEVPRVVGEHIRQDVERFLSDRGLGLGEVGRYVCHPGGPKVLEAFQKALDLRPEDLDLTWDTLRRVGNLSSASVLMVLRETMDRRPPPAGTYGLMLAMGPGFCSEMVLLQW